MTARAFIDTNIFIYALTKSQNPADHDKRIVALSIFENLLQSHSIVTSTQVLNEFHSNLIKKFKLADTIVLNLVEQNILTISIVAPVSYQTYHLAYELRQHYSFSFWDSLIVAAALENNCTTLYSEDMQHRQCVKERLIIINPFI